MHRFDDAKPAVILAFVVVTMCISIAAHSQVASGIPGRTLPKDLFGNCFVESENSFQNNCGTTYTVAWCAHDVTDENSCGEGVNLIRVLPSGAAFAWVPFGDVSHQLLTYIACKGDNSIAGRGWNVHCVGGEIESKTQKSRVVDHSNTISQGNKSQLGVVHRPSVTHLTSSASHPEDATKYVQKEGSNGIHNSCGKTISVVLCVQGDYSDCDRGLDMESDIPAGGTIAALPLKSSNSVGTVHFSACVGSGAAIANGWHVKCT
ncbi:hypothetical protein LRK24_03910 [Rhodanobacter denitrificans]|uniref:Uncharacterized protein n=1 Tax=Rhodanobacter denitrificans TaxID=666685 RepID=M4NSP9_9GAMM|nr:hypothetical protein [Rhodanobacter denitrificans]AGG90521.1 hypothetical protein R2APBS1_3458 [Rhodanobacter denitrificans]UJJ57204.1 hypothetical protein LRK55_11005 [Rhodanobacter denitrificans]UJM85904.1 hypothetical protein LRJ86_14105 [Rhodanobacter denitrificans]UJM91064.1 hypothetical protein LRK24_03910 [Rhodanobacter denitrificans]